MTKKLSVITVNLNNRNGLLKTIESVISQDFTDFEYIVIDGASTDGSCELIKQYQDRITYWVSDPDKGIFEAMNKGIRKATGEYLLFLNSGDFLLDSKVLEMVFKINPTEDILCGTALISKNNNPLYYSSPPEKFNLKFFISRNIPHQATFIKKEIFEKFGYYREDLKLKADFEFWIRTIVLNNCSTRKLNIPISDYNLDGLSMNPDYSFLSVEEMKDSLQSNIPQAIWNDYKDWFESPEKMKIVDWASKRGYVIFILKVLFQTGKYYTWVKRIFIRSYSQEK